MGRDSRAVWAKRVERWQDSGLTSTEYAAEVGINPRTLAYWKWRLGADEARARSRRRTSPAVGPADFVEVVPTAAVAAMAAPPTAAATSAPEPIAAAPAAPSADIEPLEVVLHDGLRIRVPLRFDADSLRRVVTALEGAR